MNHSLFFQILINRPVNRLFFFFFNDTATTEIYTLSLHDALPISRSGRARGRPRRRGGGDTRNRERADGSEDGDACHRGEGDGGSHVVQQQQRSVTRSEEHTSELQSHLNLVCRLLLEKKKEYTTSY